MKRFFALCVALILVLSLFSACGDNAPKGDTKLDKEIVGTVNGVDITQADYNLIYKTLYDSISQYEQYYGEDWLNQTLDGVSTIADYIKSNTASQIASMIVAQDLAEETYAIKADDKKVKKAADKQYEDFKKQIGDNDAYEKFLEDAKTTDAAVRKTILRTEIMLRYEEKATAKGGEAYVSEEDALETFGAEKMRVQHILVSTQEQTDPETGKVTEARTDAQAQKIVNEILGKLAKGADFDSLIDEYDEDPGMESGKFYVFGTGEMVQEFETASMELKVGEYTKQGVKTDYGYHIIKRYDVNKDLEEFETYKTQLAQQNLSMVLNSKLAEYETKWEEEKLDEYVLNWINEMRSARGLEPFTKEMLGINFPTEEELNKASEQEK